MAFSINKIYLVGNCTGDPELRYTPNGAATCTVNVATNRSTKDKDGNWSDVATFHRVVVWSKMAEFISKAIKKGDPVVVEGRQENRSYQTDDGQTRYVSEVVADNIIPFARKPKATGGNDNFADAEAIFTGGAKPAQPKPQAQPADDLDLTSDAGGVEKVNPDDIPF